MIRVIMSGRVELQKRGGLPGGQRRTHGRRDGGGTSSTGDRHSLLGGVYNRGIDTKHLGEEKKMMPEEKTTMRTLAIFQSSNAGG